MQDLLKEHRKSKSPCATSRFCYFLEYLEKKTQTFSTMMIIAKVAWSSNFEMSQTWHCTQEAKGLPHACSNAVCQFDLLIQEIWIPKYGHYINKVMLKSNSLVLVLCIYKRKICDICLRSLCTFEAYKPWHCLSCSWISQTLILVKTITITGFC